MSTKQIKKLLFEYASGIKLEDYLIDRVNRSWDYKQIIEEMNKYIKEAQIKRLMKSGIFSVNMSNLSRWYRLIGIKSQVKKGRKGKDNIKYVGDYQGVKVYSNPKLKKGEILLVDTKKIKKEKRNGN